MTLDHVNQQNPSVTDGLVHLGPSDQEQQTQGSQENFTPAGVPGWVDTEGVSGAKLLCLSKKRKSQAHLPELLQSIHLEFYPGHMVSVEVT